MHYDATSKRSHSLYFLLSLLLLMLLLTSTTCTTTSTATTTGAHGGSLENPSDLYVAEGVINRPRRRRFSVCGLLTLSCSGSHCPRFDIEVILRNPTLPWPLIALAVFAQRVQDSKLKTTITLARTARVLTIQPVLLVGKNSLLDCQW